MLLVALLLIDLRLRLLRRQNQKLSRLVDLRTAELHEAVTDLEATERKLADDLFFQKLLNNNITHNIRTPLRFLSEAADGLAQDAMGKEDLSARMSRHLSAGLQGLLAGVDNLSNYIKAKNRVGKAQPEHLQISQLINELFAFFRKLQPEEPVQFQAEIAADIVVHTYPELLRQLLYNLIDNALKHSGATLVVMRGARDETHISLMLSDNGYGMPEASVAALNAYLAAGENANIGAPFNGIGMKLIKELLPILQATIIYRNAPQGLEVQIKFPLGK